MSIESLKEQARRHEQKEEWQKALGQYLKAIDQLARDEQPDIGLYNRVGDLFVRVGDLDAAVTHYEQAVDLYREAFLPNNAIAVCKKIIRNVPTRHKVYLKMGQIHADQGFLPEARTNFLTYAERMQKEGNLNESFRALIEFCDLAPDDIEVRIAVADQMGANRRGREAVEQLSAAYRTVLRAGESDMLQLLADKIHALDPGFDLDGLGVVAGAGAEVELEEAEAGFGDGFGGFEIAAGVAAGAVTPPPVEEEPEEGEEEEGGFEISFAPGGTASDEALDELEFSSGDDADEAAFELPLMEFDGEEEEAEEEEFGEEFEEETTPLPTFGFDDEAEDEAEEGEPDDVAALPLMSFGVEEEAGEEAAYEPLPFLGEEPEPALSTEPDGEASSEGAWAADAFYLPPEASDQELEESEAPNAESTGAAAAEGTSEQAEQPEGEQRPAEVPAAAGPAGAGDGYIDLGSMIFGGGDDEEKTTRFRVAYQEPTGDEEADFAKMLSQFKEKVSQNLEADDVKAHHDLGTAYKEMGLLREAISEFQAALRAAPGHLPTFELMGQTFMEMGQPEAAVKSLERALQSESGVEDDLIGIYYYLARAYEDLGRRESAVEFYDRVFSLDINFADVTERLRSLR